MGRLAKTSRSRPEAGPRWRRKWAQPATMAPLSVQRAGGGTETGMGARRTSAPRRAGPALLRAAEAEVVGAAEPGPGQAQRRAARGSGGPFDGRAAGVAQPQ